MRKWVCNGTEFKVGDRVHVVKREKDFAPNGMGEGVMWENGWAGDEGDGYGCMDIFLKDQSLVYVIEHIDANGAFFESDSSLVFGFPLTSLEKVEA